MKLVVHLTNNQVQQVTTLCLVKSQIHFFLPKVIFDNSRTIFHQQNKSKKELHAGILETLKRTTIVFILF